MLLGTEERAERAKRLGWVTSASAGHALTVALPTALRAGSRAAAKSQRPKRSSSALPEARLADGADRKASTTSRMPAMALLKQSGAVERAMRHSRGQSTVFERLERGVAAGVAQQIEDAEPAGRKRVGLHAPDRLRQDGEVGGGLGALSRVQLHEAPRQVPARQRPLGDELVLVPPAPCMLVDKRPVYIAHRL